MGTYVVGRLLQVVPVVLGATLLIHLLVFLLPGDPVQALAGHRPVPEATRAAFEARHLLDEPFHVQYLHHLGGLLTGDLGRSFDGREVSTILRDRFPVTARLMLVAVAFEVVVGVVAGLVAALRRGSWLDHLVLVSTIAVVSIPVFVLAYAAQLLLGVQLGWFPISGARAGAVSYLLPGMVLGAVSLAYVARLLRSELVEALGSDFVLAARARGLPERRVVGAHALRASLVPVVTFVGVDAGALLAGAVVTEGIFNLPGVGGAVFAAIQANDGPVVVGLVTVLVLAFIALNLLVDLGYGLLDPRIRR